jgi:hypothetical protein
LLAVSTTYYKVEERSQKSQYKKLLYWISYLQNSSLLITPNPNRAQYRVKIKGYETITVSLVHPQFKTSAFLKTMQLSLHLHPIVVVLTGGTLWLSYLGKTLVKYLWFL